MRDVARSMIRFSWAMSMLGARQAANLVTPREGWSRSTEALDAVSHVAADQMGQTMKSFYQAGDRFQSGMVDTASSVLGGDWSNPGKSMNQVWESVTRTWTNKKEDLDTRPGG